MCGRTYTDTFGILAKIFYAKYIRTRQLKIVYYRIVKIQNISVGKIK